MTKCKGPYSHALAREFYAPSSTKISLTTLRGDRGPNKPQLESTLMIGVQVDFSAVALPRVPFMSEYLDLSMTPYNPRSFDFFVEEEETIPVVGTKRARTEDL
ncbi:hypothetical protein FXO38_25526 [Capsicum annuum]|nr:hypothetical protein FXO38_25526 [Capsicum annuum]